MLVTNGVMIFDTDKMVIIDTKSIQDGFQKILMSTQTGKYYYFSCYFNNYTFGETKSNSVADVDYNEIKEDIDKYIIADYHIDMLYNVYNRDDIVNIIKNDENLNEELLEEYTQEEASLIIDKFCEEILEHGAKILIDNELTHYLDTDIIESFIAYEQAVREETLIYTIIEPNKRFKIHKIEGNKFLVENHENDIEGWHYTIIDELPLEFILVYQYTNQEFNLDKVYKYFDKKNLDISVTEYQIRSLRENEKAVLWGISKVNMSKTFNNPIESKKRERLRQKKIIDLGTLCLKYNVNENDLLSFIEKKD